MSNQLKKVRNQAKFKIMELAACTRVSPATISAIERYDYCPRDTTKQKIARGLGVPVRRIWPNESEGLVA